MRMKLSRDKSVSGNLDTYIGEDTIFEGNLKSKKSLTIYGSVNGTIECEGRVVVGQGGNVEADITANDVSISGKVTGNITASSKLEMSSSGVIKGDVKTARMIMEDGSKFDGHCEMLPDGVSKGKSPKALPSKEKPELPESAS